MSKELEAIRNIGIIAHIDAGKTTVTEKMLYVSEAKHRAGAVDKGTTETDDDPEEAERGITIYSACVTFQWNNYRINLIDTPGHVDFTAEVERSLRVLDGGVVVFSAREGVEAQSETVWHQADHYGVPRIAFINKLDREGADFEGTLTEIRKRLSANPVPVQIPLGEGPPHVSDPFRGVIDLIEMQSLTFDPNSDGKTIRRSDIPDEQRGRAAVWREKLIDVLSKFSDKLMELALEEQDIPADLIHQTLREATLHQQIQPVLCGSALHSIGVQPLLDAVGAYLPSPLDRPPVEGTDPKSKESDKKIQRKPDEKEPFCGLVFKILPFKTGDMYWVRVYSGTLKPNSRVLNPGKDIKENVAQLWRIHASKKEEQIPEVKVGSIVSIIGLRDSVTGDTLCDTREPILLESIQFPETVISMAIEPESTAEKKKLADVLEMMRKQDPTFDARESEETGQTLISGMGELHLEVIKHRLLRDFNLDVKVHNPRVSYKETINHAVNVEGECDRLVAGQQLTAKIRLSLEPLGEEGPQLQVTSKPGIELAGENLQTVLQVLQEQAQGGGSLGFPLTHVKAVVTGATLDDETTTDIALRIAAADAFNKGLQEAGIVLLEPIMKLEISTPEDYVGDFTGDLLQRRAIIHNTLNRGKDTLIEAEAPLANLFGYSSAMRSLSQGRASCSMEPKAYRPAPAEVLERFL